MASVKSYLASFVWNPYFAINFTLRKLLTASFLPKSASGWLEPPEVTCWKNDLPGIWLTWLSRARDMSSTFAWAPPGIANTCSSVTIANWRHQSKHRTSTDLLKLRKNDVKVLKEKNTSTLKTNRHTQKQSKTHLKLRWRLTYSYKWNSIRYCHMQILCKLGTYVVYAWNNTQNADYMFLHKRSTWS